MPLHLPGTESLEAQLHLISDFQEGTPREDDAVEERTDRVESDVRNQGSVFLLPPKGMKPEAQGGPLLGAHDPPIHLGVNQVVERCTQQGWVYLYQPAAGPL